jgi:peptidoglycan/LPS O-acetylase OafA/YrhL
MRGGFVGVDIFFVISGFLITSLILNELRNDAFTLVAFWERRIGWIVPALFLVVFVTLVAGGFLFLPGDYYLLAKSAVAQSVLLSNVYFLQASGYFTAGVDTKPLLHTWSLAVEEQFYVLFPLVLLFLAHHKRFSIVRTILYLWIASFALSVVGTYTVPSATFYLLPTRAWELMTGAFLAAIPGRRISTSWLNEAAGLSGVGLIGYSIFCYTRETRFPGLAAIPQCLGAALIIFSGGAKPTLIGRLLSLRPVELHASVG